MLDCREILATYVGAVECRRNRITGTVITLYRSDEAGIESDPDWPWSTVCEDHGSIVSHATRSIARGSMTWPDWCQDCQEIMVARGALQGATALDGTDVERIYEYRIYLADDGLYYVVAEDGTLVSRAYRDQNAAHQAARQIARRAHEARKEAAAQARKERKGRRERERFVAAQQELDAAREIGIDAVVELLSRSSKDRRYLESCITPQEWAAYQHFRNVEAVEQQRRDMEAAVEYRRQQERREEAWAQYLEAHGWLDDDDAWLVASVLDDPKRADPQWFADAVYAIRINRETGGRIWADYATTGELTYEDIRAAMHAAHRHAYTSYDELLRRGVDRDTARLIIEEE